MCSDISIIWMCVCPWRLAMQKEGWRQQMDEGKASKTAAPFLGPGCCIHRQAPSACSE